MLVLILMTRRTQVRKLYKTGSLPLKTTPVSSAGGRRGGGLTRLCYFSPDLWGKKNDTNLIYRKNIVDPAKCPCFLKGL